MKKEVHECVECGCVSDSEDNIIYRPTGFGILFTFLVLGACGYALYNPAIIQEVIDSVEHFASMYI